MSLTSTPEHSTLRSAVRKFLVDTSSPAEVLAVQETELGYRPAMWQTMAEQLGLQGMLIAEEHGGAGAGVADAAIVAEELGRTASATPYFASSVLATLALVHCADEDAKSILLPDLAAGARIGALAFADSDGWWGAGQPTVRAEQAESGWRLGGQAHHVMFGHCADLIVVAAHHAQGLGLFAVDAAATGVGRRRELALDMTRPLALLTFDNVPAQLVSGASDIAQEFGAALDRALVLQAAERVGGARRCIELTTDYAKTRTQFGKVIGSYQGIKHGLADMVRYIEPMAAAVALAAEAADLDSAELPALASLLSGAGAERYLQVAGETIQLHGAIGFTWEHEAHLHVKRAKTDELMFGATPWHLERFLNATLADSGAAAVPPGRIDEPAPLARLRAEVRAWLHEHRDIGLPLESAHEAYRHEHSAGEYRWLDALRAGRWLCLSWPVEYGGRGLGPVEILVVEEEFAHAQLLRPDLGLGEALLAPAILSHGTPEQKERFLPRILSGEDVWCQGFSEPEAGSDLASLRTSGVVDGDELRINGEKIWTTNAGEANMMFLLCRTDLEVAKHKGITYVLVPMIDNGIEVDLIRRPSGDFGFAQERITDARAPLANVIGGLDNGWKVAMTTLGAERAGKAAVQYVGYRHEFDALIDRLGKLGRLDDQLVRQRLAVLAIGVELMRATGRVIGARVAAGQSVDELLAIDKLNWSEFHLEFGSAAMDLLGASALIRPAGDDYRLDGVQRAFLESRGRRIARGTNQIQRNIIGERVLGLPK